MMVAQGTLIKRNSFFALLSHLVRLLTNVVLFIGIARLYGPEGFGQFTAAHTLSTIFLLLADFGFDILLTSEIARQEHRAADLIQTYLSMKILFAVLATMGMMLTAYVQNVSASTRVLMYAFSLYVLFSSLANFFFALFKGLNEFQHETKISFLTNGLLLISVVVLGLMRAPLVAAAAAFIVTRLLALVLAMSVGKRKMPLRDFRFKLAKKADFGIIVVFGVHAVFSNLFFTQDTVLLSVWRGDHDVGVYQAVFKLIGVVLVIPDIIMNALLPTLSRYNEENRERWGGLGQLMNKALFLVGLPTSVVLFVYADLIINFLYGGNRFAEAIPILRVFACTIFLHFSAITFAMMLTTSRRHATRMAIVVVATIFNYVLNVYMIPRYGPMGAAVVSLATIALVGTCYIVASRPFFVHWVFNLHHAVPLVLSLLMTFLLWQLRMNGMWYIAPPVGVVYCALVYVTGFTKEERRVVFAWRSVPAI